MESPYRRELEVALATVKRAATMSQSILSALDKGVIAKDDLSLVTVGDFAVQALLAASIRHAFPGDTLVGEESADELRQTPALLDRVWELLLRYGNGNAVVAEDSESVVTLPQSKDHLCDLIDRCSAGVPGTGEERTWVFDPIDGTTTFVRGEMYAINVALLQGGQQALSVVALPVLSADVRCGATVSNSSLDPTGRGAVLFAARGYGTYVRPLFGAAEPARRIEAHAEATEVGLRSVSCVDMLFSGVDDVHAAVAERLGVAFPGCDLLGWVPRWAVLALGLANMTVWVYKRRDYHAKVWDHAGAMLLFEEVGGMVTDVDGKAIDLGAGRKLEKNFGFVAAPRRLHGAVLKAAQDTLREQEKGHLLLG